MAASSMQILSGQQLVDDGTGTAGAVPVYDANGALPSVAPSRPTSALGGAAYYLRLTDAKNDDGSAPTASTLSGGFALANTTGTSLALVSEGAKNNTKTDKALFEWMVPQFYKSGDGMTITASALFAANSGTVSVKTLLPVVYVMTDVGTVSGSNLISGGAQTLTTLAAAYSWAVDGTGVTPGSRLTIGLTGVITETANAGSGAKITVNSVKVSG